MRLFLSARCSLRALAESQSRTLYNTAVVSARSLLLRASLITLKASCSYVRILPLLLLREGVGASGRGAVTCWAGHATTLTSNLAAATPLRT